MASTSTCILEELKHVEMLKEESIRAYDVYKSCESYSKMEQAINSEKQKLKNRYII